MRSAAGSADKNIITFLDTSSKETVEQPRRLRSYNNCFLFQDGLRADGAGAPRILLGALVLLRAMLLLSSAESEVTEPEVAAQKVERR